MPVEDRKSHMPAPTISERAGERAIDLLKFIALAALGSTLISSIIGVASLAWSGLAPWDQVLTIWLTWWVGDAVGAVLVTPAILAWVDEPRIHWSRWRVAEALAL